MHDHYTMEELGSPSSGLLLLKKKQTPKNHLGGWCYLSLFSFVGIGGQGVSGGK